MASESSNPNQPASHVKRRRKSAPTIWISGGSPDTPSLRSATVTFGSVTIKSARPSQLEIQHNVELGYTALSKVKPKLLQPGVTLRSGKGVPLYHADPEHPELVIRVLDGQSERGLFEGGKFKIV